MILDFARLSAGQKYHLMIQSIIPRPIAWILTKNRNGTFNLAPFSYFNAVCSEPPVVMVSIGYKSDGSKKDTRVNIEREQEFVIHIPAGDQALEVTQSAYEYEEDESEVDALGLELAPSFGAGRIPKLRASRVAFYCRLYDLKEIGERKQALIFGEIVAADIDDRLVSDDGHGRLRIDAEAMNPLARLGGNDYMTFGQVKTVAREKRRPV